MRKEAIPVFLFSTVPSLNFNQVHLTYHSLPLPSLQDLSAEDPALAFKDILISVPKRSELSQFMKFKDYTPLKIKCYTQCLANSESVLCYSYHQSFKLGMSYKALLGSHSIRENKRLEERLTWLIDKGRKGKAQASAGLLSIN